MGYLKNKISLFFHWNLLKSSIKSKKGETEIESNVVTWILLLAFLFIVFSILYMIFGGGKDIISAIRDIRLFGRA
jgi:hypothetical protein